MFVRTSDHLISVGLADKTGRVVETLKTTRQHPFYVDGKGWVPAGALGIGNAIVTRAGPRLFVKSIKWNRRAEGYTVYNFEVEALSGKEADGENTHSYFVGNVAGGAWVHNGACLKAIEGVGQDFAEAMKKVAKEEGVTGLRGAVQASAHNGGGQLRGGAASVVRGLQDDIPIGYGDFVYKKQAADGGFFKVWFRRDPHTWDITHYLKGDDIFDHATPYINR